MAKKGRPGESRYRRRESLGAIVRLLAALAARGRHITEGDATGDAATVPVRGAEGTVPECGRDALAGAIERGWVGPAGPNRLGLTAAGRDALRRARAEQAAVKAEGPASAATAPASPKVKRTERPLSWLASRRDATGRPMLTIEQVQAGERLSRDFHFSQLTPRVTMGWSGISGSGDRRAQAAGLGRDLTDNIVAARSRVTAALTSVGPELADILIDVCGHFRGLEEIAEAENWPRRAARLLLQRALSALARHYGLEPPVRIEDTIARRLRHWGAEDYRPTLARWRGQRSD